MPDKKVFRGMTLPLLSHPECRNDEVFMQFVNKPELQNGLKSPWQTLRLGNPEPDPTYGEIYPVFVKKQELIDAGMILVPSD